MIVSLCSRESPRVTFVHPTEDPSYRKRYTRGDRDLEDDLGEILRRLEPEVPIQLARHDDRVPRLHFQTHEAAKEPGLVLRAPEHHLAAVALLDAGADRFGVRVQDIEGILSAARAE